MKHLILTLLAIGLISCQHKPLPLHSTCAIGSCNTSENGACTCPKAQIGYCSCPNGSELGPTSDPSNL